MSSEPIRDPVKDHLLTPQNSAFIIIDYQLVQVNSIASMDRQTLVNNITGAAKAAVVYGLPIIHSTVNVKTGLNRPPIPTIRKALEKYPTYDRTTNNSWEDVEFRKAVEAGTQETHHDGPVDGGVSDIPRARCLEGRL
jgi:nicotinamidase-related amidase